MMSGNKEFTNLPMSVAMIPMIFDAFPPNAIHVVVFQFNNLLNNFTPLLKS